MPEPARERLSEGERESLRQCQRALAIFVTFFLAVLAFVWVPQKSGATLAVEELGVLSALNVQQLLLDEAQDKDLAFAQYLKSPLIRSILAALKEHELQLDTSPSRTYEEPGFSCERSPPPQSKQTSCPIVQIYPGAPDFTSSGLEQIAGYFSDAKVLRIYYAKLRPEHLTSLEALLNSVKGVRNGNLIQIECLDLESCELIISPDDHRILEDGDHNRLNNLGFERESIGSDLLVRLQEKGSALVTKAPNGRLTFLPRVSEFWPEIKDETPERAMAILQGRAEAEARSLHAFGLSINPNTISALVPLLALAVSGNLLLCLQMLAGATSGSNVAHRYWILTMPGWVARLASIVVLIVVPLGVLGWAAWLAYTEHSPLAWLAMFSLIAIVFCGCSFRTVWKLSLADLSAAE